MYYTRYIFVKALLAHLLPQPRRLQRRAHLCVEPQRLFEGARRRWRIAAQRRQARLTFVKIRLKTFRSGLSDQGLDPNERVIHAGEIVPIRAVKQRMHQCE